MKRFMIATLVALLLALSVVPVAAQADTLSFTMSFAFDERGVDTVSTIDEALSALMLSSVKMDESDGYLNTTTTVENGQSTTSYSYGLDRLSFKCEKDDGDLRTWHFGAEACPADVYADSGAFVDAWSQAHPDSVIRSMTMYEFGDADAFVYLYHDKAE